MKLSEGVEWGLHCTGVLASLPAKATLPTKALAEYHGVSETYLSKHLQALTRGGIIESVPGPRGGYRLARPATEITLLDVVEAIDGPEPAFRCTEIRQQGPCAIESSAYRIPCTIHVAMARAEKLWRDELRTQTIADIVAQLSDKVPQRVQHLAEKWLSEHVRTASEKA